MPMKFMIGGGTKNALPFYEFILKITFSMGSSADDSNNEMKNSNKIKPRTAPNPACCPPLSRNPNGKKNPS